MTVYHVAATGERIDQPRDGDDFPAFETACGKRSRYAVDHDDLSDIWTARERHGVSLCAACGWDRLAPATLAR